MGVAVVLVTGFERCHLLPSFSTEITSIINTFGVVYIGIMLQIIFYIMQKGFSVSEMDFIVLVENYLFLFFPHTYTSWSFLNPVLISSPTKKLISLTKNNIKNL